MRKVGIGLAVLFSLVVIVVLHYSLPQHDIVRIVGTDVKRMDLGGRTWFWAEADNMTDQSGNRDVRFINAVLPDGSPYVYRNEDTNWSFPPYLKFDSGSMTARAQAAVSTAAEPEWVIVTHYGWRIELLTIFPNVVDIDPADGPDQTIIPWFNIVFLTSIAGLILLIRSFLIRLRERHIDPIQEDIENTFDDVSESSRRKVDGLMARWRRWIDSWKSKPNRRR